MEQNQATDLNALYVNQLIPIALIDDPARPERETMEPRELAELAASIEEVGLINPLTVKAVGDRYEVTAGHRRLIACNIAKFSPVPCRVLTNAGINPLSILVAENAYREQVNPIEEARFYARCLTELYENDIDAMARALKRRRDHIDDRLALLLGYPQVIEALAEKKITIAAARALNRVTDPNRLNILLSTTVQQGANARQVLEWVQAGNEQPPIQLPPDEAGAQAAAAAAAAKLYAPTCIFCNDTEDLYLMELAHIHRTCKRHLHKMIGYAPVITDGAQG